MQFNNFPISPNPQNSSFSYNLDVLEGVKKFIKMHFKAFTLFNAYELIFSFTVIFILI